MTLLNVQKKSAAAACLAAAAEKKNTLKIFHSVGVDLTFLVI